MTRFTRVTAARRVSAEPRDRDAATDLHGHEVTFETACHADRFIARGGPESD